MKPAKERPRKDSGVSWLGSLPEGWQAVPLKQRTTLVSRGRSPDYSDDETGIPIVNQACIYWDGLRFDNVKWHRKDRPGGARGRLFEGDLLVNSTGTGTLGRAAVFERSGEYFADSHVTVVRTNREATAKFLRYVLQTDIYQGYLYSVLAPGATNQIELSREGLRRTPFPMPPLAEQRAIAAFLDRKTAAIDALVAKKERLIELLQEKRQALITQAVTKGLDPNARMRSSGIEWLGDIPAHWAVMPLKRFASVEYGAGGELDHTASSGTPIISLPNVTKDGRLVLLDELSLRPLTEKERAWCLLRKGDLLFNWRNGSVDHVGKTALFDEPGEFTHVSFLLRIRLDPRRADPGFYWLVLNGLRASRFFAASKFQVNVTYNQTELRQVPLPLPPLEEQRRLSTTLRSITTQLDRLQEKTTRSIERLGEYRQALITAAVSGQLDIPAEAA